MTVIDIGTVPPLNDPNGVALVVTDLATIEMIIDLMACAEEVREAHEASELVFAERKEILPSAPIEEQKRYDILGRWQMWADDAYDDARDRLMEAAHRG